MGYRLRFASAAALLCLLHVCACAAVTITGRVIDENGAPVSGARITLAVNGLLTHAESGEAGRFEMRDLDDGPYELRVEKPGFYVLVNRDFRPSEGTPLDLVLNHTQEYEEKVEVQYAVPAIDLQKLSSTNTLDSKAFVDIPYPSSHDFRNGLALQPGIVQDNAGKIHLNGGAEDQVLYTLDGFELTNPFSGALEYRVPVDAIREINVDSSRYAAEFGKSSAGTLPIESGNGDDHYRYGITNFIPTGQLGGAGLLSKWTPRGTVSGPWLRGRAWFFNAADAQYGKTQVDELPSGANRTSRWIANDLFRNQFLVGKSTMLSSTLLANYSGEDHFGLGPRSPIETTLNHQERNYLLSLRAQQFRVNGAVYELGFAASRMKTADTPMGDTAFRVAPNGLSGNYFERSELASHRWQALANALLSPKTWHGKHEVKIGVDGSWIGFDRLLQRSPFETLRDDGTLMRRTMFLGPSAYGEANFEQGFYVQDHWQLNQRTVLEVGGRQDWNRAVNRLAFSPRIALAFAPFSNDRTKLSLGWGLFYDTVSLNTLAQDENLDRQDFIYGIDGATVLQTLLRRWVVPASGLRLPKTSNFSAGIDQKLPGRFYLRTSYIHRRTSDAFAFLAPPVDGVYTLGNGRHARYDAVELRAEHHLGKGYTWMASYTRSVAHSNAALNLAVTDPLFGIQGPGPLDWDTPNRMVSRAWFPIGAKYGLAYVVDWRSGYPFTVFSEKQGLVGGANSYRYPQYFSLNLEVERVVHFHKYRWGLRLGFVNLTNHKNPNTVDNMLESSNFLNFSGGQRRAFVTRIRLIGKD